VPPRVALGVPVDAEKPLDLRRHARLLEYFALDRVLQLLAKLHEASGQREPPSIRFLPALDEDELPSMEKDGVHRHARDVPAHGAHSRLGVLMPAFFANATASSYPASAWRTTPRPGSVVSTRSIRAAAPFVPSHTTRAPACVE